MIKRYISLLLMILALLAVSAAAADSSFDMECWVKTGGETTLYQPSSSDGGLVVGGTDLASNFSASGTLPAGTYVKILDTLSTYGLDKVSYSGGSGYVLSTSLVDAVGSVSLDDGTSVGIPEAMVGHTAAIIAYLTENYPNATFSAISGSSVIHVEYTGNVTWKQPVTESLAFTYVSSDGEKTATISALGSAYTAIVVDGEKLTVPTSSIKWNSEVGEDKQIAFINAPRTGRASMHLKASSKSTIVQKCKQGKVVAVISTGKNYTKVWCDNYVGYIQTSALTFCAHKAPEVTTSLAYITFRGKTKSNNEMNVRAEAKASSRILGCYKAGTQAILFGTSEDGEWSEIEVNGIHCYILSVYVTKASDLGI